MKNDNFNFGDFFTDYLDAYKTTSDYQDRSRMEIYLQKAEYEENLDKMWSIYIGGNPRQIINYNSGLNQIKEVGLKVYRNSLEKHKIMLPKNS